MRAHSTRHANQCKGPVPAGPKKPEAAPPLPATPGPADRAARLTALRARLAGTAPAFEARRTLLDEGVQP